MKVFLKASMKEKCTKCGHYPDEDAIICTCSCHTEFRVRSIKS